GPNPRHQFVLGEAVIGDSENGLLSVERPNDPVLLLGGKSKHTRLRRDVVSASGGCALPRSVVFPFVVRAAATVDDRASNWQVASQMDAVGTEDLGVAIRTAKGDHTTVEKIDPKQTSRSQVGRQADRKPALSEYVTYTLAWHRRAEWTPGPRTDVS